MFFANDINGYRTYIDQAAKESEYFCPVCNCRMQIKRGEIVSHHFAHINKKACDPWYINKMSLWHKKMQSFFPQTWQEQIIWNAEHTEFHIADVEFSFRGIPYVIEFQHSAISRNEFRDRSLFYIDQGYQVVWIFDFCECKKPKRIYYSYKDEISGDMTLVWPGNDKIKTFDFTELQRYKDYLHIFFYINTGQGREVLRERDDLPSWYTWEYENPFVLERYFVKLKYDYYTKLDKFYVAYYEESEFISLLQNYIE